MTVNVDENGKRLNRDFLYRRSDRIRRELEQKYGLHPAERKNQGLDNPLRKVDASAGDVKKAGGQHREGSERAVPLPDDGRIPCAPFLI